MMTERVAREVTSRTLARRAVARSDSTSPTERSGASISNLTMGSSRTGCARFARVGQRERRAGADGARRRRGPVRLQGKRFDRDAGEGLPPQDAARRRRREALLQSLAQERRGVNIGRDRHGRFVGLLVVVQRRYFEAQAAEEALAAERRVVDHIR